MNINTTKAKKHAKCFRSLSPINRFKKKNPYRSNWQIIVMPYTTPIEWLNCKYQWTCKKGKFTKKKLARLHSKCHEIVTSRQNWRYFNIYFCVNKCFPIISVSSKQTNILRGFNYHARVIKKTITIKIYMADSKIGLPSFISHFCLQHFS